MDVPLEILAELPTEGDTADQVIRMSSINAVIALIATLPKDQAEAVLLRVVVGLDVEETARVMGNVPARCGPRRGVGCVGWRSGSSRRRTRTLWTGCGQV